MLQSIKNLSIRRKLKLAFGTIILFCTVAALLGALGIGTVFTHSRTLYTDYGQAQGSVNRILAVFKQNELLTGSLLLNRDPQGQQQLLTALNANRADLLDRLEAGDAAGYFDHLDPETCWNWNPCWTPILPPRPKWYRWWKTAAPTTP